MPLDDAYDATLAFLVGCGYQIALALLDAHIKVGSSKLSAEHPSRHYFTAGNDGVKYYNCAFCQTLACVFFAGAELTQ